MDKRLTLPISLAIAGLWALAGGVWATIPPTPSAVACATAIEQDTRAALAADPELVEIATPTECQGFSATELAGIVASTTPIARPYAEKPAPPRPAPTAASYPPRPTRTTVAPAPRPSRTTVPPATTAPVPTPTPSPPPGDPGTPTPSDSPEPAATTPINAPPSTGAPV